MDIYQILIILVVDTRVLGRVTNSLQERRFASIGPTDYKDTKASIFRSEVIGIAHDCCGWVKGKERLRGSAAVLLQVQRAVLRPEAKLEPKRMFLHSSSLFTCTTYRQLANRCPSSSYSYTKVMKLAETLSKRYYYSLLSNCYPRIRFTLPFLLLIGVFFLFGSSSIDTSIPLSLCHSQLQTSYQILETSHAHPIMNSQ
jgi:hypothetical protein